MKYKDGRRDYMRVGKHKLEPRHIAAIEAALDGDKNLIIKPGPEGIPKIYTQNISKIM